jgi:hypothetical protein
MGTDMKMICCLINASEDCNHFGHDNVCIGIQLMLLQGWLPQTCVKRIVYGASYLEVKHHFHASLQLPKKTFVAIV